MHLEIGTVSSLGVDQGELRAFIGEHWHHQIALTVENFYEWQFTASPDNAGIDNTVVVIDKLGNIHGFCGLNDRKFFLEGQPFKGAELTTWIHSEKARGQYAIAVLQFLKKRYDVLIGTGISDSAWPLYLHSGFKIVAKLPRFVRVFDWKALKNCADITPLGRRILRNTGSVEEVTFSSTPTTLEDCEELVKQFRVAFNGLSRSPEHLRWRYERHPYFNYEINRVTSKGSDGLLVLRYEHKYSEGLKFVHVIDLIGAPNVIPAMISCAEQKALAYGASFIDMTSTASLHAAATWTRGWTSILDEPMVRIPNRFYPIEQRVPPTTSMTLWSRHNMDSLLDLGKLCFTKGDCDLDRPTMNFLIEHKLI